MLQRSVFIVLVLIGCWGCASSPQTPAIEKEWQTLFNGKDLTGWTVKIKDHPLNDNFGNTFRVEDSLLKVSYDQYDEFKQQYGHLFYQKKFGAYLLVVEYRFTGSQVKGGEGWALRNSGVMLHGQDPATMPVEQDFPVSLEMQILGGNGTDPRPTGNLCTPGTNVYLDDTLFTPHCVNSSSKTYVDSQWVRSEALVLGDSLIRHIVEGDTVMTYTHPEYDGNDPWVQKVGLKGGAPLKEGTISLQSESNPIEFRKVILFDLAPYINDPVKLQAVLKALQVRDPVKY